MHNVFWVPAMPTCLIRIALLIVHKKEIMDVCAQYCPMADHVKIEE